MKTQPQNSIVTILQPDTTIHPILPSAFPGLGIVYFIKTPSLWLRVVFHLVVSVMFVIACIVVLFSIVLPLQAKSLETVVASGWAWTISVLLVLIESCVATILVGLIYLQAFALDDIFDKVMLQHGYHLTLNQPKHGFWRGVYRFIHPILYLFMTLLILPINLIPIFGQVLFGFLISYAISWGCHLHYFDLKCMTWSESKEYILLHWKEYFMFGYVGGLLEAIPVVGLFFMMTNVIGSALWAVEMEKSGCAPSMIHVGNPTELI